MLRARHHRIAVPSVLPLANTVSAQARKTADNDWGLNDECPCKENTRSVSSAQYVLFYTQTGGM
jgi:hypothetical protein